MRILKWLPVLEAWQMADPPRVMAPAIPALIAPAAATEFFQIIVSARENLDSAE